MSQYIFNPFIENLDKVNGVITGIQIVGVIRNADTNPPYPSLTPVVNQAWLVANNAGTVGGQSVVIGDLVLYTESGWEIIPNGTVFIPIATEIAAGIVRIATGAEVTAGSVDDAAITPLKLINYLQSTDFGAELVPQLFQRLTSDGTVTLTDLTTSIQISLPSVVTAGTYGSQSDTLELTLDAQGRVDAISIVPIEITTSQINDIASYITNNFPSLITSSTLDIAPGTIDLTSITTPGTYGSVSQFPIVTIDEYGRVTSITTSSVTGNPNFVEDVQDIIGSSLNSTTLNISYNDPSGLTTIEIPNTGITPSTYGSGSQVGVFTVNSQGRLTSASNVSIQIAASQVSDFTNAVRNILSTSAGNTSNITLTWNPTLNQFFADLTNVGTLGTYGNGSTIPVITTDVKGRVTNVGLVNINWAAGTFTASQITDLSSATRTIIGSALQDSTELDFIYDGGTLTTTAVLQPSGVTAGTYTKLTVDTKGRVTSGTFLSSSDIPAHTHDAAQITSGIFNVARLGVNPQPNTFLRGDGQFAVVTPSFGNQTPNTVFAGPASAPSDQPVFRSLVINDLPNSGVTPGSYGTSTLIPIVTVNAKGQVTSITTTTLTAPDAVWGGISGDINLQSDLITLLGGYQLRSEKGQPNGYASLDVSGRLPSSQLTIHGHSISDIAGLSTALDGKANVSHTHVASDVTDFLEAVQDVIGSTLAPGTGISVTYNDLTGQVLIENTQTPFTFEEAQDAAASLITAGIHSGVSVVYDDGNNRLNFTVAADWSTNVINKPTTFPPDSHTHVAADITDFSSAVAALSTNNILQGGNSFGSDPVRIGSNTNVALELETNNTVRATILNDGRIGIGNATADSTKYVIVKSQNATATSSAFVVQRNSDDVDIFTISSTGELRFGTPGTGRASLRALAGNPGNTSIEVQGPNNGEALRITGGAFAVATSGSLLNVTTGTYARTSGSFNLLRIGNTINPTSGDATDNLIHLDPTINQTGTALGEIRGINIEPTTTAVLGRFIGLRINTGTAGNVAHITLQSGNTGSLFTNGTRLELSGVNFRINNLNNGGVSILTNNTSRLAVLSNGDTTIANATISNAFQWTNSSSSLVLRGNSDTSGTILSMGGLNGDKIIADNAGRLGIGTASPNYPLFVYSNTSDTTIGTNAAVVIHNNNGTGNVSGSITELLFSDAGQGANTVNGLNSGHIFAGISAVLTSGNNLTSSGGLRFVTRASTASTLTSKMELSREGNVTFSNTTIANAFEWSNSGSSLTVRGNSDTTGTAFQAGGLVGTRFQVANNGTIMLGSTSGRYLITNSSTTNTSTDIDLHGFGSFVAFTGSVGQGAIRIGNFAGINNPANASNLFGAYTGATTTSLSNITALGFGARSPVSNAAVIAGVVPLTNFFLNRHLPTTSGFVDTNVNANGASININGQSGFDSGATDRNGGDIRLIAGRGVNAGGISGEVILAAYRKDSTIGTYNVNQSLFRGRMNASNIRELAFFGNTPITRPVVPTGSTLDTLITALQNLGLISQT